MHLGEVSIVSTSTQSGRLCSSVESLADNELGVLISTGCHRVRSEQNFVCLIASLPKINISPELRFRNRNSCRAIVHALTLRIFALALLARVLLSSSSVEFDAIHRDEFTLCAIRRILLPGFYLICLAATLIQTEYHLIAKQHFER